MERDALIKALFDAARNPEGAEEVERVLEGEVGDRAVEIFGSHRSAMAAALVEAVSAEDRPRKSSRDSGVADVAREIDESFEHPLYVETDDGRLYGMEGPKLGTSPAIPPSDEGGLRDGVRAIHYIGDAQGVFLFSNQGRFFGLDARLIPSWDRRDERRSIRDLLFLPAEEAIRAIVPRKRLVSGRVVHITRGAKGKASEARDLGDGQDRSGRQAFKVRDGDDVVAVIGAARDTTIFCASALGRGIHFESDEMRTMGLKAVGVNVMKLDGDDDAVVAAFEGRRVRQVAMITEEGLGKRVDFSEFRTQGRAGQGMQLARLNRGDRIAGVVPCNPAEDLAVTTTSGRVWRVPTAAFHMMGRPAKGNQMIELADGERVRHLEALPCSGAVGS